MCLGDRSRASVQVAPRGQSMASYEHLRSCTSRKSGLDRRSNYRSTQPDVHEVGGLRSIEESVYSAERSIIQWH